MSLSGLLSLCVFLLLGCSTFEDRHRSENNSETVGSPVIDDPDRSGSGDDRNTGSEIPDAGASETFDAVESLVEQLSEAISERDYATWREHLSEEYVEHFSNAGVLSEIERAPVLRQSGIRVRSLRDYFEHVVVPSRVDATLDRIVELSEGDITAIARVGSQDVVLYRFIWVDGFWKVAPFSV